MNNINAATIIDGPDEVLNSLALELDELSETNISSSTTKSDSYWSNAGSYSSSVSLLPKSSNPPKLNSINSSKPF